MASDLGIGSIQPGGITPVPSGPQDRSATAPVSADTSSQVPPNAGVTGTPTSYAGLFAGVDETNQKAAATRRTDASLSKIGDLIDQMKAALDSARQSPRDGAERKRYLASFWGLHGEIQALTVPPDPEWYGTGPQPQNGTGSGAKTTSDAANQLQLPLLSAATPTDSDILAALNNLAGAATTITNRRDKLAESFRNAFGTGAADVSQAIALSTVGQSQIASTPAPISLQRATLLAVVSGLLGG